jgi:ribosome biogenesis protein Tsr3
MNLDSPTAESMLRLMRERYPALVRNIRFLPGRVVLTPGAAQALKDTPDTDPLDYLIRHLTGDWGEIDAHDRKVNEEALRQGHRLLSCYALPDGRRLWIITEADRSASTFLLPQEY